jgi:hypothetical protein
MDHSIEWSIAEAAFALRHRTLRLSSENIFLFFDLKKTLGMELGFRLPLFSPRRL